MQTIRLLTIGNSFADNAITFLQPLAESTGRVRFEIGTANIGKGWGNGISVYTEGGGGIMAANTTYLLVARYTFQTGNDLIHLWVNPIPGQQPADGDASVITRAFDNPASNTLYIRMQPYGLGSYDIDELCVGRSYAEVVPVQP